MMNDAPAQKGKPAGASARAAHWIRQCLDKGIWRPGERLPGLDALAKQAGVARCTMWIAIRSLRQEKRVVTKQGSGIFAGGGDFSEAVFFDKPWRRIAHAITQSIVIGEFLPGSPLPSQVALGLRYHAVYHSMRKALRYLTKTRVLACTGTNYVVPVLGSRDSMLETVLFSEGVVATNEGQRQLIHLSEQVAREKGVKLSRFDYSYSNTFNRIAVKQALGRDTTAGAIIDFWGLGNPQREENFKSLILTLGALKKPVTILDEVGGLVLPQSLSSNPRFCTIASAGEIAGEDAGRFLMQLGHYQIAFIATAQDQKWSQRRFRGLSRVIEGSGATKARVILCETPSIHGPADLVTAVAQLSALEINTLVGSRVSPSEPRGPAIHHLAIARRLKLSRTEIVRMREQARWAAKLFEHAESTLAAQLARIAAMEMIGGKYSYRFLRPTLEKLFADPDITAWVAANDGVGCAALDFLAEKKALSEISVVGFDNTLVAAERNLTSYEFDLRGRLHHAFSFALGKIDKPARHFEWPGVFFQRKSSRKAL
jgi:DNA-binding LacI/PurR family transcriptional regulator/DNA-binding transcriptional regulator YhcF (GntR family)